MQVALESLAEWKRQCEAEQSSSGYLKAQLREIQTSTDISLKIAEEERSKHIQQIATLQKQLAEVNEQKAALIQQYEQEKLNLELSTIDSLKGQIDELKKVFEAPILFDDNSNGHVDTSV